MKSLALLCAIFLSLPAGAGAPAGGEESLAGLKQQARLISDEFRKEPLEVEEEVSVENFGQSKAKEEESSAAVTERLLSRIGRLESDQRIGPSMKRVLERVAELIRTFPERWYARAHPAGLVNALSRELNQAAKTAKTPEQLVSTLDAALRLPENASGLPKDIALKDFKEMGGILIFLAVDEQTVVSGLTLPGAGRDG